MLDAVIARCEADLLTPAAFEGSGALVTWRRATAVQMVRGGASLEEAARASGLSPDRVAAVLDGVERHGRRALAPDHEEAVPDRLSRQQRTAIRDVLNGPPSAGQHQRPTLPVALDRVVMAGVVPDLSQRTLRRSFRLRRPWEDRAKANALAPPGEVAMGLVMVMIGLGAAALAVVERSGYVIAVPVGLVFFSLGVVLVWSGLVGIRLQRRIRASLPAVEPGPSSPGPWDRGSDTASTELSVHNVLTLADPPGNEAVSGDVLYLWIFDAPLSQWDLFDHGWIDIAPIRLLANVQLLQVGQRRRALQEPGAIIDGEVALDRCLAELTYERDSHRSPALAIPWLPQRYDGYPLTVVIASNAMWKAAFNRLHDRAGLVVVNLSGFALDHPGLAHELREILRPPSPAPEVFLIDATTDADEAIAFLIEIHRSVDATDPLVVVRLPRPDRVAKQSYRLVFDRFRRSRQGHPGVDAIPVAARVTALAAGDR